MNIEILYERDHFKSILNLTFEINLQSELIVRPMIYRYALMENPKIDKFELPKLQQYDEIIKFLKNLNLIKLGCIKSKPDLSNKLKILIDKELLYKKEIDQIPYYFITNKAQKLVIKNLLNTVINRMPNFVLSNITTGFINRDLSSLILGFYQYRYLSLKQHKKNLELLVEKLNNEYKNLTNE